jgi:hypothetical protein
MRQPQDVVDGGEALPTDGLVVEEIQDEDTIRLFIRSWRMRVNQEYTRSVLESYDGGPYPGRPLP